MKLFDILIKHGYVNWESGKYQKKIQDEKGIKYFINIDHIQITNFDGWFPSIQFHIMVNNQPKSIDISLVQWLNDSGKHTGITIKDVEEYMESVWIKLDGLYYE